jgi:CHRD domain-containing protein
MLRKLCAGVVTSVLIMGGAAACSDDETGPALETNFTASLSGAAERPTPVTTTATGSATVTIDDATSTIAFSVTVTGLLSPTMAHIHVGGVNDAGPIALSLLATAPPVGTFTGVLTTGTGTAAQIVGETFATLAAKIRAGTAYINVHTVANTNGEIRGQLVEQ